MKLPRSGFLIGIGLLTALSALAQVPAYLEKGTVEGAGFGGFVTGLGRTSGGFGGNIGVAASRNIIPYGEVSFFPGLASLASLQTITGSNVNLTSTTKVSFTDFHGGVHIRANNVFRSPSVMPYFAVGLGVLRNSETTGRVTGTVDGAPFDRQFTSSADSNFAVNFGAGIRVYSRSNLGLRAEVKGYKPTGSGPRSDAFVKVTIGVFFYINKK